MWIELDNSTHTLYTLKRPEPNPSHFSKMLQVLEDRARKMAMNPGARMVAEGPGRREVPTNLKSRQSLGARLKACTYMQSVIEFDRYLSVCLATITNLLVKEKKPHRCLVSFTERMALEFHRDTPWALSG